MKGLQACIQAFFKSLVVSRVLKLNLLILVSIEVKTRVSLLNLTMPTTAIALYLQVYELFIGLTPGLLEASLIKPNPVRAKLDCLRRYDDD